MFDPIKKVQELIVMPSENELVEFKEAKNDYDFRKIGKYFSALSNEANLKNADCAWLVFGVADVSRQYVNSRYRPNEPNLQRLKAEIGAKMTAGLTFIEIYAFEVEPGRRVVLFQIPPAPLGLPIAWDGHYYARNHEELVPLNIEKIERIRIQSTRKDWSKGICKDASIDDLAPEAIARARELFKRKNPQLSNDVDGWSDNIFLNKAKITIDGHITNTAILLLGKPESVHYLSPAVSKISWILRDKKGIELDYEHFTSPLILSIDKLYSKIRNLKYRYMQDGSLFPEEVYKYDPYVIREALNNCIAHQDYLLGGKINVVENEDDSLVFSNLGSFLPVRVENVIMSDAPSEFYRNRFLSDAMVNLSMIDTIGSGIRKMFNAQRAKFFPLPEYDLTENQVTVTIIGKVLDLNYARKLAQIPDLTLDTIVLLDKVQKKKQLSADEASHLRSLGLIEGKRPNLYVSSKVARDTNEKTDYMKRRGIDDKYCKKMIIDYLKEFKNGTRYDFEDMLLEKLPSNLTMIQKKNKVRNILQSMKKEQKIKLNDTRSWTLINS
jgi:ATP-dependent DNA helicase RecG